MMAVPTANDIDVEIEKGTGTEGTQKFFDQLKVEPPDRGYVVGCLIMKIGSATQIDRDLDQCFIHWEECPSITPDAGLIAEGLGEALAENDRRILDAVMIVHLQVSAHIDLQVEQAVLAEESEHVIEERDTCLN